MSRIDDKLDEINSRTRRIEERKLADDTEERYERWKDRYPVQTGKPSYDRCNEYQHPKTRKEALKNIVISFSLFLVFSTITSIYAHYGNVEFDLFMLLIPGMFFIWALAEIFNYFDLSD